MAGLWEAREARDEALERVSVRSPEWRALAYHYLKALALHRERVTSETLWAYLEARGIPVPDEPRAMGPVMLKATKDGLLRPLGYVAGRRVAAHGRPVREYESLVYMDRSGT